MKIYIAGKIFGDPNFREKFKNVQKALEGMGDLVLNPAILPDGLSAGEYMRICFAMIDVADAVLFLPDWQQSGGAQLEKEYCDYTKKTYGTMEVTIDEKNAQTT
ncbi:MAG: DUF4406 domain-containing protein [Oscillospiraceae bacterium]|nr:DUF4406 domain-containing protein [Oscillospiraceae bacterium]